MKNMFDKIDEEFNDIKNNHSEPNYFEAHSKFVIFFKNMVNGQKCKIKYNNILVDELKNFEIALDFADEGFNEQTKHLMEYWKKYIDKKGFGLNIDIKGHLEYVNFGNAILCNNGRRILCRDLDLAKKIMSYFNILTDTYEVERVW